MLKNINDSRKQQLEKLKNFTDTVNEEIANIVGTLGWTVESVTDVDKEYFTCPYDPSHRLTEASLNDHLISCQWKAEGYGKLDVPLPEPILPEDSPFCIKFDKQLQEQVLRNAKEQNSAMQTENFIVLSFMIILLQLYEKNKFLTLIIGMGERLVPRTSDRIVIDFTSDERKALYDYVIANTTKPDVGEDIANINNLEPQEKEDKELSFLELLIQERNLKRRRVKHKGVHTNKRSYVEILREVINQQMEIFVDYVSEQSNSGHVTDVRNTETDDLNYEQIQDRTEHLYKVFHSSRNNDEYNSRERNGHHHKKKREHSEERNYHRSRERDRQKRYLNETDKKHKHEHRNIEISSHSRERKSHKKDKYRSKDKHKDKYSEKKHKSGDRDKSSERRSKHSDHKRARKDKSKEY
ncbi:U11/U12 small nuclear ribonucleoprotein 48 kDa protein [Atta colombica]|uniref:U11/U12 small nuclear ribonucleoprotein 48 kDa protein n=1 Tax=Atta colombica TaxID=520822 RepID=A0A195BM43_9HYME|nr:U11/U12 small nuclear ribonucleoprotein 48 kDa protein [Atta colombica]